MRMTWQASRLPLVAAITTISAMAAAQPPPEATPPRPAPADDMAPLAVPSDLVQAHPGGITADQVGVRAAATSWSAKAMEETLRGAAARVDEAWAAFLPRLSGIGKYTRLSEFTPPAISFGPPGSGLLAATGAGTAGGPVNYCPSSSSGQAAPAGCAITIPGFSFPVVFNNWLLQGTITVPISGYFVSIEQNYTAATRSQDAARWDVVGARATAAANGRVAYYTWLRARGALIVAVQALNDQRTHVRDARNQFSVGNASRADVLRAETALASAELALEQARNLSDLSEKQLRVAIHASGETPLAPGEDLETALTPLPGNLQALIAQALRDRPEIKSADANAAAARKQAQVAASNRYPVVSAFADGIVGNPNPRIFPQTQDTFASWDVGAQVTWAANDVLTANGSVSEAESRAAATEANENNTRDGIEVDVTQAWQNVQQADFSMNSSTRELASAEEAYRVQRELFNNGRGTSTTLTDAETDLTRARLDLLNAKTDARIARIRLEHAIGGDARPAEH